MASNAKFEIEIYGDTAQFENSLKGVNTAMKGLKGEASQLKRELRLDPTNTDKMAQLQKNLQQQLSVTKQKSAELRKELSQIDRSTPKGNEEFVKLSKQLKDSEIQAGYLEKEIGQVDDALKRGNWKVDLETDQAESKLSKLKGSFSALKEVTIGAFRQIGSNIVSSVSGQLGEWVGDAKSTQKAMIALKNTMDFSGNGKDFDSISTRMQKLAADTNANTEDTLKLATTFIGLGDSSKVAGDKVDALVRANQAFGGTGENLQGVVQAYGQMSAAGKVTAENINQLTDNNTALGAALKTTVMEMNPALSKYSSFSEASADGAVSVEMLDKAMTKLGKAGGGSVETIDDAMASFNETVSLALLPALDAITPVVTKVINSMTDMIPAISATIGAIVQWFKDLWDTIAASGALQSFGDAWDNIVDTFKILLGSLDPVTGKMKELGSSQDSVGGAINAIASAVKTFADALKIVTGYLKSFVEWFKQGGTDVEVFKGFVVGLAAAFATLKTINTVTSMVGKFMTTWSNATKAFGIAKGAITGLWGVIAANPITAIVVAIAAVVAGLVYFFTQTETGKAIWASFTQFLTDSWQAVLDFFSGIGEWFSNLWTTTVETTKSIWSGITEFFSNLWNGIVTVVQNVWNAVASATTTAFNTVINIFQPIISVFQSIFNLVVAVFELGWAVISGVAKVTFNAIVAVWNVIVSVFQTIWNAVSNVVSTVFSAIGSFAQSAWGVVTGIWNGIANFFSPIFNAVKNVVSTVFNAFGNFAQSAWSAVTSIWNAVSSWFSGIFDGVTGTVSGVFDQFGGFAQNAWNAITGVFDGIVGWFSDLFGGVADVVNSVLGGITGTIDKITGAINGVTGKVKDFFGGSLVSDLRNVSFAGTGMIQNSASNSSTSIVNTFNITPTNGMSATDVARAVRREFNQGRA